MRIADTGTGTLKMVSLGITEQLLSQCPCIQRFHFVFLLKFSEGTRIVQRVCLGLSKRT